METEIHRTGRVRWRLPLLTVAALAATLVAAAVAFSSRTDSTTALRDATTCAFLTRAGSIGAIGQSGPQETLNVLAYPVPAAARIVGNASLTSSAAEGASSIGALFDECAGGWSTPATALPLTLQIHVVQEGAHVQRFAFWQDPDSPRSMWIRDFELLVSAAPEGDAFRVLLLDRPPQLLATPEQQWFQIMRPGMGAAPQPAPDVLPVKCLLLRVLSTHGPHGTGADGISLGDLGAYGPDLEVVVDDRRPMTGEFGQVRCGERRPNDFLNELMFCPPQVKALAGRPRFVLLMNRSRAEAHTFVTVGQEQNLELRAEPGQTVWGHFVASRLRGEYDYYCRLPGHTVRGLVGTITVR